MTGTRFAEPGASKVVAEQASFTKAARRTLPATDLILAVGASGKFAGLVVPALAAKGARVRGLLRTPEQADRVREAGAAEIAIAELNDTAAVESALDGVTSVFYIAPAFIPHEATVGTQMVQAAVRAGVRRFVFSSVIHPVLSRLVNHHAKAPVEEAVLDSGMEFTFLHPAVYFQNYAQAWPTIAKTGILAEPWSSDTRFSRVDFRDVAEVAAIALTEDRLLNGTFELCSDGALNRHQVAELIEDVLGRKIEAKRIVPESLPGQAGPMRQMFEYYDHHSLLGNPLILRTILGRKPRTLRAYFEELAAN